MGSYISYIYESWVCFLPVIAPRHQQISVIGASAISKKRPCVSSKLNPTSRRLIYFILITSGLPPSHGQRPSYLPFGSRQPPPLPVFLLASGSRRLPPSTRAARLCLATVGSRCLQPPPLHLRHLITGSRRHLVTDRRGEEAREESVRRTWRARSPGPQQPASREATREDKVREKK
ncbi:uncharacterized protein [Zea mays]|uniref:uncharacterized protein isoform X2 n=1 Tax=Zea mays TaxID=4577 RepID=UPI001652263E|nr:uncharacterized protein LOC118476879 isoform X2 [Zea mays]